MCANVCRVVESVTVILQKHPKNEDKYLENAPIGPWMGWSSTPTHRWVSALAGQAVPTGQSPFIRQSSFMYLFYFQILL